MRSAVALFLLAILINAHNAYGAQAVNQAPAGAAYPTPIGLTARDNPGDTGGAILLTWTGPDSLPPGAVFEVRRTEPPAYDWTTIGTVPSGTKRYVDGSAESGKVYRYELRVAAAPDTAAAAGDTAAMALAGPGVVSDPASAHDNWIRPERVNSLIVSLLFTVSVLGSIWMARSGKPLFIRKIAGLNAVDEAIGRATELGKKVLYVPGIQSMDDIQTVASLAILGHVARATARYGTDLDVPNKDPLTFASARETVRAAYMAEGRPDLFREEMVNYVTYDQFAYTAAVSGRMVRERPAANFLIGHFFAESLILAETGQSTGAIQIAGMADPTQLPFFVATCDYTLIGEELYAASAYLSREPVLLGSIRGQDIVKGIGILWGIVGIGAASLGIPWFAQVLQTR